MLFRNIMKRADDSYVIEYNGFPYHVPNEGEFAELWREVHACALARPDEVTGEPEEELKPPTLDEARAVKLAEIMRGYQAAFAPIEAVYPSAEREGWAVQEAEAKALLASPQANPAVIAPVLSTLVQVRARGESPADLAARVLQNAGQWRMIYAYLTGQQQRMYGEVCGLTDAGEILAYPVVYHLPEGL